MKSTRSTDESTQSRKQITKPMRLTLRRAVIALVVVLSGSGLIVLNNDFTFNFNIFGWGQPDDREVRISVGTDASGRDECPQGAVCRNYRYELTGFNPPPYTLECWEDGNRESPSEGSERTWSGTWSGRSETGCYSWGSGQTVHVVVDGVKSNELLWDRPDNGQPDDGEVQPDGREVRISAGTDASGRSECPRGAVCRNYRYELTGLDLAPYTLECWTNDRLLWSGNWSGNPATGCYSWGSGQTVHVVVDGVKSNELLWVQPG